MQNIIWIYPSTENTKSLDIQAQHHDDLQARDTKFAFTTIKIAVPLW